MKNILVLTDFSIRADHATHYALKLAQKIKANILLCNVFLIPSTTPMATQVAWPMENYETLEEDSVNDLAAYVHKLNDELNIEILIDGGFRPDIQYFSKAGFVAETISEIAANHHVAMVVIGAHCHKGLSSFLSGDHAKDVMEQAHCPVLLVPDLVRFKDYKKITFASDLSQTDIEVLHSLSGLAKHSDAEILITHIAEDSAAKQKDEPTVRIFLSMVSSKINYNKIYYRAVEGKNITSGIDWVAGHIDVDLLVMVHRKKGFFRSLFEGSVTQKMADHLTKPLLIFPGSKVADTMPVF